MGRLGGRRSDWWGSQGIFLGVLLEFHEFTTLSRVDGESHALLAMANLPTVEPHWVRVFHGELRPREGLLDFSHWHTDKTNQHSELDATAE